MRSQVEPPSQERQMLSQSQTLPSSAKYLSFQPVALLTVAM